MFFVLFHRLFGGGDIMRVMDTNKKMTDAILAGAVVCVLIDHPIGRREAICCINNYSYFTYPRMDLVLVGRRLYVFQNRTEHERSVVETYSRKPHTTADLR
jgi:hypothetical protein